MSAKNYLKYAPFYLVSLLPFWIIYGIARFAYFLMFYVAGYRKKVVFRNLRNSFPNKSEKEIKEDAKSFYKHFCEVFLEAVKLLTISAKNIKKRYFFKNPELLNNLYNEEKSITNAEIEEVKALMGENFYEVTAEGLTAARDKLAVIFGMEDVKTLL